MKKAIVLLSGGLDSATVLALAHKQGYEVFALSFSYGQRHHWELTCAKSVAVTHGVVEHRIVEIDLRAFGGSALTSDVPVPKGRTVAEMTQGVPNTYVPARNTIFLSYAVAWAEVLGVKDIFLGVNALDYSGYPDCRPEYIKAFETMANVATTNVEVKLHTPLINMSKSDIIGLGLSLGVDYSITSSCYEPSPIGEPCKQCDSCQLRQDGFKNNNAVDTLEKRFEK